MVSIDEQIRLWKQIPTKQGEAINRIIKRHEAEILRWNTEDQLNKKGIGGDSAELNPKYARSTIKRKSRLGQTTSHVTLRDTETFHDNFTIIYEADQVEIISQDSLTAHLRSRYGKEIFGLTEENMNKLRAIVKAELVNELLNG